MGIALITNNILSDSGTAVAGLVPTSRTISTTAPLTGGGDLSADRTIAIPAATTSVNGYLTSTDWTTFNAKQVAGNYIVSLTGEATATGPGAAAVTLNNASVTGKVLTGVNITGGTVLATDTMLTAFGKLQNQINGLIGSTIYQGVWNATTNTPTLASGVGTRGYYYIVNVAGNTNLDGTTDWQIGDWAIYDGTAWQKVDNTESVTSVNGFTGAVSLTTDNIAEGATNLYFSNARSRSAISLTTTGSSGFATYNNTTGVLNIPQYQSVLTNPITGSLTASYIPKATGATTLGNSIIYENATGIGIGTNGPLARLHVDSSAALTAIFDCSASDTYVSWQNDTSPFGDIGSAASLATGGASNDFAIRARSTYNLIFATDATEKMRLTNGGKLGIGTTTVPTGRLLAVSGGAQFNGAALMEGANFSIIPAANGQDGVILNIGYDTGTDYGSLFINTGGNTSMTLNKNGAVTFAGSATATSIIKVGGTSSQFLMADGSTSTGSFGSYLPLAGGTMTGNINWGQTDRGITWAFNTDGASIKFYNTGDGDTDSRLEFATIDNNNEYFRWVHTAAGTTYESMRLVPVSDGNAEFTVKGKIIKSGGTSSQFLMADGSINTSVSPTGAYLPLSGGTLTGALSGTSASFSSSVTAGNTSTFSNGSGLSAIFSNGGGASNYNSIELRGGTVGSSVNWQISKDNSTANAFELAPSTTNGGTSYASPVFKITSAGAATFSSSVTAGEIISTVGNGIVSGGGSWAIAPSSTRGIIAINGSGDQLLTFSSQSYIYNNSSLFRMLSTSDIDFVSGGSQRMIIKNSGNVGIGTTSPSSILELSASAPTLTLNGSAGSAVDTIKFNSSGTTYASIISNGGSGEQRYSIGPSAGWGGYHTFYTDTSERMRITSGGNVLIGTTTDNGTARLQVNGGILSLTDLSYSAGYALYPRNASVNDWWLGRYTNSATEQIQNCIGQSGTNNWRLGYFNPSNSSYITTTIITALGAATFSSSVTATSFFESSDATIKTLITDNYQAKGIESVVAKLYTKNGKEELGYYAQDVQGILPSAVSKGTDGLLSLSYREVHTAKIARLERRVAELEQQLNLN